MDNTCALPTWMLPLSVSKRKSNALILKIITQSIQNIRTDILAYQTADQSLIFMNWLKTYNKNNI